MATHDKLLVTVAPCIPPDAARAMPGLDLSPENLPLSVALNWQSLAPTADCDATDKIRITAIREN